MKSSASACLRRLTIRPFGGPPEHDDLRPRSDPNYLPDVSVKSAVLRPGLISTSSSVFTL